MKSFKQLREEMMVIPIPQGGGDFYDEDGNLQYRVNSNNKIYDENGNLIGKMDSNDRVFDKNGNKIGEWK